MRKKLFIIIGLLMTSPYVVQAQGVALNPLLDNLPRFFICVVAGLLLAIGFQALLTTLSVASGISAIGNIRKKAHRSSDHKHRDKGKSDNSSVLQKVSSGFGIWTMLTVSISLFFASFLAVKLSLVGANFIGLTLGLVIWAAFFTSMLYLEVKSVTSLVGGLINTMVTGLRSSVSAVSDTFGRSSESEAKSVARVSAQENARAMRKELQKLFNRNDLDKKIDDYVNRLSPEELDVNRIKKELKDLLTDLEVEEKAALGDKGVTRRLFIETASKTPNISKEDVKKLGGVFDEVKGIATSNAGNMEKAEMAAARFTPVSREDIDAFKEKVTEYLKATDKQELQPERIRKDIQTILQDPKKAKGILQHKASQVDHDTLVNILAQRDDVSREDAEKYAQYAEKALHTLKEHLGSAGNGHNHHYSEERPGEIRIVKEGEERSQSLSAQAKGKLEAFFDSLQEKKDFNMEKIKSDFSSMFSSSDSDTEGLTYKLKHYNKDEMSHFLAKNTAIPADKADQIAAAAVEARDSVLKKANEVEKEVKLRLEQAEDEALIQVENTRKAAASAAWWLVGTAVLSGAASAVGGILALGSWMF